jgi:hypothetical protein
MDTELSVIASSLFNDIEGIESGQSITAKLGDVEIGGTDANPTIRDNQSVQGSQGSDVSDGVGSGTAILGAETSPRRTRSGKIVKYRAE